MLLLAEVIVTSAPVAARLPVAVPLLPTVTLPRLNEVGVTANWPCAAVPVPVITVEVVEGKAVLANVRVAFASPAACGLKLTENVALLPAGIVTGNDIPLSVNRELLLLADMTVTSPPVAERVPVADPLFPTVTLPTLNVAGVMANWP